MMDASFTKLMWDESLRQSRDMEFKAMKRVDVSIQQPMWDNYFCSYQIKYGNLPKERSLKFGSINTKVIPDFFFCNKAQKTCKYLKKKLLFPASAGFSGFSRNFKDFSKNRRSNMAFSFSK